MPRVVVPNTDKICKEDYQAMPRNAMPRLVVPNTDKICQEDFPKAFFKAPYEKGNEQFLSQSAMYLTLCHLSTDGIDN